MGSKFSELKTTVEIAFLEMLQKDGKYVKKMNTSFSNKSAGSIYVQLVITLEQGFSRIGTRIEKKIDFRVLKQRIEKESISRSIAGSSDDNPLTSSYAASGHQASPRNISEYIECTSNASDISISKDSSKQLPSKTLKKYIITIGNPGSVNRAVKRKLTNEKEIYQMLMKGGIAEHQLPKGVHIVDKDNNIDGEDDQMLGDSADLLDFVMNAIPVNIYADNVKDIR